MYAVALSLGTYFSLYFIVSFHVALYILLLSIKLLFFIVIFSNINIKATADIKYFVRYTKHIPNIKIPYTNI